MSETFLENLTLYALGLLDSETAAATEVHLRAHGLRAKQELQAIEHVIGALGYGAPVARPRPELRQRLFDRIAPESNASC